MQSKPATLRLALLTVAIASLLVAASGCVGQEAVSNETNHFSYGGQAASKQGTQTYHWQNTMGSARVHWGAQSGSGHVTLAVTDAHGKQVYSGGYGGASQGGSDGATSAGAVGDWTIRLSFSDFTGQMGLSVDAAPGYGGFHFP